jgi:import inner membrane translocase subunit TIM44
MQAARRGVVSSIQAGLRSPARPSALRIGGNQRIRTVERTRVYSLLAERRAALPSVAGSQPVVLRSEFSTLGQWRNKKEEERKLEEESEKKAEEEGGEKEKKEEEKKEEEKKEAPPPPPPHGDKSPFAVFMETLQTEFKKSQEWQESTKQLADSANQFTESPAVRKAREVSSKTAEVTGKVAEKTAETLGKGAATVGKGIEWTWNTPVVKAGRIVAKKTAEGVDHVTKPVRETKVYKDVTSNIKEVVDDGASSRYGGFLEQEERKRQRELRQSKAPKVERFEEDLKYVFLPYYITMFIANILAAPV